MSGTSIRRLRVHMMLLSLGVLILTLGFNLLLSVSTLDSLAADVILSGYRSSGEHFARSVERGMRFGKPLESYAGMGEMLRQVQLGTRGVTRMEIVDATGAVLYTQAGTMEGISRSGDDTVSGQDNSQISGRSGGPASGQAANEKGDNTDPNANRTRPDDLKLMQSGQASPADAVIQLADGYRILIPLQNKGLAGWLAMEISAEQVDRAAGSFLHWSLGLALGACIVVTLILTGWLGMLTGTDENRSSLHTSLGRLLLVLIGGTQLAYSAGTLVLFDSFVEQAVRTKTEIIATSIKRDFEYLIHKGVDVVTLRGKDQLLQQVVEATPELKGAYLVTPDGKTVASAGVFSSADTAIERPLDAYWTNRFSQRQHVMLLRLVLDRGTITERLFRLAMDLGTSLLISLLFLMELAKLLGLVVSKSLTPDGAQNDSSYAAQALRAAGFIFFLGYDMGISFIPLLARKLYQPFWGLSEEIVIGLPISAEMVSAGIALLVSGTFSQRHGWHTTYLLGIASAAAGLLLGGLATNLPMLIAARIIAGFGFGLVLMASQLGTLGSAKAGAGLAGVFAGIFSGSICGSAAGAMIAEHMSFEAALLTGAVIILFAARAVLFGRATPASDTNAAFALGTNAALASGTNAASTTVSAAGSGAAKLAAASPFTGSSGLLKDPRMHLILLLAGIPAAICLTGFLHYMLPLLLNAEHVEQADIGRIFMLYGLCFITAGPLIGRWIDRTADKAVFLMLMGLLSGVALLLGTGKGVFMAAFAVVALGLAQCIAAPATMLCVLALTSAQRLGKEKTASIYRSMERIGQVAGPMLFGGAIVALGSQQALTLMGVGICSAALVFMAAWRFSSPKNSPKN
ncbi:MFS transporter [Desulfovibrio subterraneus]|uniref:MFS transporter n=1 Tax=Desulfovibrio subterraneus TaxID=2718620 RepID=UPI0022B91AF4|nr:MFS transporter [Desulfovibrio subterraneus]WBF66265.1 MFS transporter [Desulfovibrio subterraneus]